MFENLKKFWKGDSLVNAAIQETHDMFALAMEMFTAVSDHFFHGTEVPFDIYKKDKQINALETNIRRNVLIHLSTNQKPDINTSLVLTTVVVDIERLGDYSKNVFELSNMISHLPKDTKLRQQMEIVAGLLTEVFAGTAEALKSENLEKAQDMMEKCRQAKLQCETMIEEAAAGESLSSEEAIGMVLYARYLKRVASHLSHIASSVYNSFDMIGSYKKDKTA